MYCIQDTPVGLPAPLILKRLVQNSSWDGLAGLTTIFSSGGALAPDVYSSDLCA